MTEAQQSYVELSGAAGGSRPHSGGSRLPTDPPHQLTPAEIARLRALLYAQALDEERLREDTAGGLNSAIAQTRSVDSDYTYFGESTHAWAVFADDPKRSAGQPQRLIGTMMIIFQLLTYRLFAVEAMEDYRSGRVAVTVQHADCLAANEQPEQNFSCEAEFTNKMDAFVAFFMLGIFLTGDLLQAGRVLAKAPWGVPMCFAVLAAVEVVCAFLAASIAVSYSLFIGELTDAVEVGVGLLFIRELSQRAYAGIRYGKTKQYLQFFSVLTLLVVAGMCMDPAYAYLFAGHVQ
jgi:hypothetical protein